MQGTKICRYSRAKHNLNIAVFSFLRETEVHSTNRVLKLDRNVYVQFEFRSVEFDAAAA